MQLNKYQSMVAENPNKYPARMGIPWNQEELNKLLTSIQEDETIEEIAVKHQRTVGGIKSKLLQLAVNYYTNNNMAIEEVTKITRVGRSEVEEAILKKNAEVQTPSSRRPASFTFDPNNVAEKSEVVSILRDIQRTLHVLANRLGATV